MSLTNNVNIEYWLIIIVEVSNTSLSADETPALITAKHDNYPIMKWLKYHHANLSIQDADGKIPQPPFLSHYGRHIHFFFCNKVYSNTSEIN